MKLWKGNRLDAVYELSNKEIATRFLNSKYYSEEICIERALVDFITSKDGLNSTWEWDKKKSSITGSSDILEILDLIGEVLAC